MLQCVFVRHLIYNLLLSVLLSVDTEMALNKLYLTFTEKLIHHIKNAQAAAFWRLMLEMNS